MTQDVTFSRRHDSVSPLIGGLAGLLYPTLLVGAALSVGFRRGGDMGDFAASLAASVLFLIAAPTAWIMSFSFIDVTRFTILVFGIVTSFPFWYLLGSGLARGTRSWASWALRYFVVSISWTAFNLLLFAVVASVAS